MIKLALFGHPVTHSRSPEIHRHFGARAGIELEYTAIDCPSGALAAALDAFQRGGGVGCNLTVPLKAEGLALAASATPAAHDAGAANTLVWREDRWLADNTDGAGLLADLGRLGIAVHDRSVLILGAGGAVAGVLGPLLAAGVRRICLLNRSLERARALAVRFAGRGAEIDVARPENGPAGARFDLVIQATSLGHRSAAPRLLADWLSDDARAYDLNYGPAFVPFQRLCERLGIPVHPGTGMLIEQAALAFERFTGIRPATEALHRLAEGWDSGRRLTS
ncbi:MAG: shikimate dehydrogenase [Wenzhouxiangellaceae bacterium]